MAKRLHLAILASAATLAAILPLRGDPRIAPVTHPEWARLLLRALDVPDAVRATPRASHAFAALSWKSSLAFRGDDFTAGQHVRVGTEGQVVAEAPSGEVTYPLSIVRPGDYRLRVLAAGDVPFTAEIRPYGRNEAAATFDVTALPAPGWLEAGVTHLDPGAYTASLLLPPGTSVEHVEVAPPCVNAVEPRGGWRPTAIVERSDLAVTALQAVDGESDLPPAASPVDVPAGQFQSEDPRVLEVSASSGLTSGSLQGGQDGTRAWALLELPEDGLYTLSVFGRKGAGMRFLADQCLKAILCPSPRETEAAWWVVTTTSMTAGPHAIAVNLGAGATVERIRLERKKATDDDYVATLRRLGFDAGEPGHVSRAKAVDAMEWIRGRRRQSERVGCGDVIPRLEVDTRMAAQAAGATPPGGTTPPGGGGGGTPPAGGGGGGGTPPGPNPPIPLPSPGPSQPPGSAVTIASSGRQLR